MLAKHRKTRKKQKLAPLLGLVVSHRIQKHTDDFKHIKVQLERINTLSMIIKYIYLSQILLFQCKFFLISLGTYRKKCYLCIEKS